MSEKRDWLWGAAVGAAVCAPLGVGAGVLLAGVLEPAAPHVSPVPMVVLVALAFAGWGAFIGGMLRAQAKGTPRQKL